MEKTSYENPVEFQQTNGRELWVKVFAGGVELDMDVQGYPMDDGSHLFVVRGNLPANSRIIFEAAMEGNELEPLLMHPVPNQGHQATATHGDLLHPGGIEACCHVRCSRCAPKEAAAAV